MGVSKNGGFPQQLLGFPTKNEHFGVEIGGYHHFRKHPYPSMGSCHMRCLELNHRTAGECANRVKPASIDMEKGFLGCQRAGKKGVSN